MTKIQRIGNILTGMMLIIIGIVIFVIPESGYPFAIIIIGLTMTLTGLRLLIYYITMARHMVGGKIMLFIGIIALDAGMVSLSLNNSPRRVMMVYLLGTYAFYGLVDVLRANEARQVGAQSWRLKMTMGLTNLALAFLAGLFVIIGKAGSIFSFLYGAGLLYSGILRIVSAFRRTSIVYIQ